MNLIPLPKSILAGFALTVPAHATVLLFADNFDRPDNTDLNASTAGQSGSVSPLTWVEKVASANEDPVIDTNRLRFGDGLAGGGWSVAYPDHNFIDSAITTSGEFTVTVDLAGAANRGGTRFNGFAVGHSQAEVDGWAANNPANFDSDFFFGLDTTGSGSFGFYTYENGTQKLLSATVPAGGTAELSVNFTGFSDFNSGTTVSYEALIDGTSAGSGTFNWSGTNENYIALYSNFNNNNALQDNFAVSTIPEPSSLALLSFLSLLAARRRR